MIKQGRMILAESVIDIGMNKNKCETLYRKVPRRHTTCVA